MTTDEYERTAVAFIGVVRAVLESIASLDLEDALLGCRTIMNRLGRTDWITINHTHRIL